MEKINIFQNGKRRFLLTVLHVGVGAGVGVGVGVGVSVGVGVGVVLDVGVGEGVGVGQKCKNINMCQIIEKNQHFLKWKMLFFSYCTS